MPGDGHSICPGECVVDFLDLNLCRQITTACDCACALISLSRFRRLDHIHLCAFVGFLREFRTFSRSFFSAVEIKIFKLKREKVVDCENSTLMCLLCLM